MNNITYRPYQSADIAEMAALFYETVHTVNAKDYSEEQRNAWADGTVDLEGWNRSFLEHKTLVALDGEKIVGFADMEKGGYLDRLYVHREYQGQGIASALCDQLERAETGKRFTTHASITARSFFEGRGYRVIKEQQVERKGIFLTNYVMEKEEETE